MCVGVGGGGGVYCNEEKAKGERTCSSFQRLHDCLLFFFFLLPIILIVHVLPLAFHFPLVYHRSELCKAIVGSKYLHLHMKLIVSSCYQVNLSRCEVISPPFFHFFFNMCLAILVHDLVLKLKCKTLLGKWHSYEERYLHYVHPNRSGVCARAQGWIQS